MVPLALRPPDVVLANYSDTEPREAHRTREGFSDRSVLRIAGFSLPRLDKGNENMRKRTATPGHFFTTSDDDVRPKGAIS